MGSKYTIRRLRTLAAVEAHIPPLHRVILPYDECGSDFLSTNQHWLVRDKDGNPVGFASACVLKNEPGVFLSRSGILPGHRGAGLQRRLIRIRVRFATFLRKRYVLTYAARYNYKSICNLIREGFRLYEPKRKWGLSDGLYFYKMLD
jgi:GNAT superfamily N-acetyltransferase